MTRERINDFKKIVLPSISKLLFDVNYEGQGKCDAEEFAKDFKEILDLAAKALEQEPKTGDWIGHREHCENLGVLPSGLGAYEWCSNCDCGIDVREWHRNHYNYCPNCGARMSESKFFCKSSRVIL